MNATPGLSFMTKRAGPAALLRSARDVVPVLREFAGQADEDSLLPGQAVAALRDAGMFRLGVPASMGGAEAGVRTCLEVTAELARGCPSSAWITALGYAGQQMAASFGDDVRAELWGDTPDVPICGSFSPASVAVTPAGGGQVVSGRWPSSSGAYQARWAAIGVPVADASGQVTGQGLALIPRADFRIEDTWDMAGMRGTGSHSLIVTECFVPSCRIRSLGELLTGGREDCEPLYRAPAGPLTIVTTGPLLGAAEEIFALTMVVVAKGKPMAGTFYQSLADSPGVRGSLADAANLIDSARLHLLRSADYVDAAIAGEAEFADSLARARVRMDTGYAVTCLREAARLLLTVGGASSFARGNPVQRLWRDLETGSRHPILNPDVTREIYGRALVGVPQPVSPFL